MGIYDRVAHPSDLDAIMEIEQLTNPRVRTEMGNLALVRLEDRVTGPGTTPIMAAFTNSLPSRFGDGTFGIYYAAHSERTAIAETRYHRQRFMHYTREPAADLDMRVYHADIRGAFDDVRTRGPRAKIYDSESYVASQAYGGRKYRARANGIVYRSVRDSAGECIAVFRPKLVQNCRAVAYLIYRWDGNSIIDVLRAESITGTERRL